MIAFLHTNKAHISNFENLVRAHNTSVEIKHYVNKDILDEALKTGVTNTEQFEKEIKAIRQDNPSLIVCTCSTYGAESDKFSDVYRIDQPIVDFLVTNYTKIGLVYTANSTKTISDALIRRIANAKSKTISIVECDCAHLWKHFEANDLDLYNKGIAEAVMKMADAVDVFFLAQASMAGAINFLEALKKPIYTSPEYGVKTLLEQLSK